jgi:hypothetical protein
MSLEAEAIPLIIRDHKQQNKQHHKNLGNELKTNPRRKRHLQNLRQSYSGR